MIPKRGGAANCSLVTAAYSQVCINVDFKIDILTEELAEARNNKNTVFKPQVSW